MGNTYINIDTGKSEDLKYIYFDLLKKFTKMKH